jgi:IS1 family transposase
MLVRGVGIRDISAILRISVSKVLKTLTSGIYAIQPKKEHYDRLEIDEFWTYVGEKKHKVWFIYVWYRESGEVMGYVWGKRELKTAKKLQKRLGITWDTIAGDDWDSFLTVFADDKRSTGKAYTGEIEGNNCRLRHRIGRAFRRICCFSRKLFNHWKAFNMAFHYINYDLV